ncbi:MAG: thymidylate synthase [Candidatus Parcubacteria bacterium]|nr:thymidylate synthase [Candidatus Parcubacteria bacterium]
MSWPKYYTNQILIPSPEGFIGIVSGWTKKEHIEELISAENKNKIGAIGQLYSKEGINYIIRNLFLNPQMTRLIVTGRDLSGSVKFLQDFLNSGTGQDIIHKEIPAEKIQDFINWFKTNSVFIPEQEIDKYLTNAKVSAQTWIPEITEFPDPAQRENIDFPSEEICFRLEDKKIADLWLKVLDRILKFGVNKMSQYSEMQRELINITTIINDENPEDPFLPDYLYFTRQDLENYYPQLMTDRIFEGVEYTYGSRFRNFNGINQIEAVIKDLKANNYSRRAIAFTWDVMKDTGNPKSPCINLVNALVQGDKVYLSTYIRSNDMYRAWPQNAFALRKVQKEIADALNLKLGKLCIISNSAHIYERDFLAASEMVEKHKPQTECVQDPRGSFELKVENGKIVASHYSPTGQFIQKFEGLTAAEIGNQIFTFISDILHALDLGKELMKAELALKNNLTYIQDREIKI